MKQRRAAGEQKPRRVYGRPFPPLSYSTLDQKAFDFSLMRAVRRAVSGIGVKIEMDSADWVLLGFP